MAAASVFCENGPFGHWLASVAGRALLRGAAPASPRPAAPAAIAPWMTCRRVAAGQPRRVCCLLIVGVIAPKRVLSCIEKIDDGFDFLIGQNEIAPEWRHHCLRI